MKCKNCRKKITDVVFIDDTREVTLTCDCGFVFKFKAKPRKRITLKLLSEKPCMAVYEYGVLREATKEELEDKKLDIIKMAINLKVL